MAANGSFRVRTNKLTLPQLVFFGIFKALPLGFKTAAEVIFVVLAGGIMFGMLEKSRMVENTIGTLVKNIGHARRLMMVVALTYAFGMLGVVIGYEHNIAMVPIAAVITLALGGDLVLAAGISVGAITGGFRPLPHQSLYRWHWTQDR